MRRGNEPQNVTKKPRGPVQLKKRPAKKMITIIMPPRHLTVAAIAAANQRESLWFLWDRKLYMEETPLGGMVRIDNASPLAMLLEGKYDEASLEYPERQVPHHADVPGLAERLALGMVGVKPGLVVLTDAELFVRRIQKLVRKGQLDRKEVKILALHEGGVAEVEMRADGRWATQWPDGFFCEREAELFD